MIEAKRRFAIFLLLAFVLAAATGYLVLKKVKDLNTELGGSSAQLTKMDIPNNFVTEPCSFRNRSF